MSLNVHLKIKEINSLQLISADKLKYTDSAEILQMCG